MELAEKQVLGKTTVSKLRNGVDHWDEYQQAKQDDAWGVANSLAHSAAGREIEFLTGRIHSQETGDIEIVAYTAEHLIYFRGLPGSGGQGFKVLPRRALTQLEVHSSPAVLTSSKFGTNPMGSYKVSYGDLVEFKLPLVQRHNDYEGLDAFAPSLWDDLTK